MVYVRVYVIHTVGLFRGRQRPTVFENRVLRKIFGSVRDDVTGDWRKLRGGELHNLYFLPNIDSFVT